MSDSALLKLYREQEEKLTQAELQIEVLKSLLYEESYREGCGSPINNDDEMDELIQKKLKEWESYKTGNKK